MHIISLKNAALIDTCRRSGIFAITILAFLLQSMIFGCQSGETDETIQPARPVTYLTLAKRTPVSQSLVAGSVESWKRETLGFDVNGRLRFVKDRGTNVQGPATDDAGNILQAGTLVAELESPRFKVAVSKAAADIRDIEAEVFRAKRDFERQRNIFEKGAGAKSFLDKAEADYKAARARLEAAQAKLTKTKIDLADTLLFAPFSGQVARLHAIRGGYVERGEPVATIQMMDPIKVEVAVSPEVEQNLNYNDLVLVYGGPGEAPLHGWVHNKAPTADTATRTFMATLLVRNRLVEIGIPDEVDPQDIIRTNALYSLESEKADGQPPFFASEDTLYKDKDGFFVWKADGVTINDLGGTFNPVFTVSKVRVKPGERFIRAFGLFSFRELVDIGTLNPETDLGVANAPSDLQEGQSVVWVRKNWLLRPGQVVGVDLQQGRLNTGFYVPVLSVMKEGAGYHVFAVESVDETHQRAVRVAVKTGQNIGTLIEIIPEAADRLSDGMKVIVDGAAYLREGDPVNAFVEVEVKL